MKERILIVTSPCSSFVNHVDHSVAWLITLLQHLQLEPKVVLAGLAFQRVLGQEAFQQMLATTPCEPVHLQAFQSTLALSEAVSAIWFVQDDSEPDPSYSDRYVSFLQTAFPEQELLVFTNGLSSDRYRRWASHRGIRTIPKSVLKTLSVHQVSLSTGDAGSLSTLLHEQFVHQSSATSAEVSGELAFGKMGEYAPLLEQHRLLTEADSFVRLPLGLNETESTPLIAQLLAYARQYKILDFDLGFVDLDNPDSRVKLSEIADAFQTVSYSVRFHCTLPADSPVEYFEYLERAKVNSVSLLPNTISDDRLIDDQETLLLNLHRISAVKKLHGLGIRVHWRLLLSPVNFGSDNWIKFINELSIFFGFPAPAGLHWVAPLPRTDDNRSHSSSTTELVAEVLDGLIKCLTDWRLHPKEHYLSRGTGPAFSRLFDKRGELETWRFLNLNPLQADLYNQLDTVVHADSLKAGMQHIAPEKIDNFLAFLVRQRMLIAVNDHYYLNASQRRDFTQAWATAEL